MRDKLGTCETMNVITGQIHASGATANTCIGSAIDTNGFKEVLMVVCASAIGTGGSTADLYVTLQESADQNGGTWATINDGMVSGTCTTTYMALVACTGGATMVNTGNYTGKLYERLNDGTRKRYIRPTVYAVGSAPSVKVTYSVAFIMSRCTDTGIYILNPTVTATNGSEYYTDGYLSQTAMA